MSTRDDLEWEAERVETRERHVDAQSYKDSKKKTNSTGNYFARIFLHVDIVTVQSDG